VLSGGGTILDNGCHLFDLVRRFLGDARSCVSTTTSLYWDAPVEDFGVGVFTTESGGLAVVQSSWTEWTPYFSVDVYGTEGVITIDNRLPCERTTLVRRGEAARAFDFSRDRNDTYAMELAAYVDARRNGDPPQPTGIDGLRVVEMADAVYRSARSGRSVLVDRASEPE
jgi:predicted dehydrogenase